MNNLPVVEMFHSIQGEGKYTGYPSVFIRVTGCNLRCVFKGSICDTSYTSFNPEKPICGTPEEVYEEFNKLIKDFPETKHIVITGGEPLLYRDGVKRLIELIDGIMDREYIYTIETNGTLPPIDPWRNSSGIDMEHIIDLHSVSPKLSTSVDHNCVHLTKEQRDRHNKTRINMDSLSKYASRFYTPSIGSVQFKFVYSGEESLIEIRDILNQFDYIENDSILLMPEGTTNEQLNNIQRECVEVCLKEGWRFCDRLHIRIFGDIRGV